MHKQGVLFTRAMYFQSTLLHWQYIVKSFYINNKKNKNKNKNKKLAYCNFTCFSFSSKAKTGIVNKSVFN